MTEEYGTNWTDEQKTADEWYVNGMCFKPYTYHCIVSNGELTHEYTKTFWAYNDSIAYQVLAKWNCWGKVPNLSKVTYTYTLL